MPALKTEASPPTKIIKIIMNKIVKIVLKNNFILKDKNKIQK